MTGVRWYLDQVLQLAAV